MIFFPLNIGLICAPWSTLGFIQWPKVFVFLSSSVLISVGSSNPDSCLVWRWWNQAWLQALIFQWCYIFSIMNTPNLGCLANWVVLSLDRGYKTRLSEDLVLWCWYCLMYFNFYHHHYHLSSLLWGIIICTTCLPHEDVVRVMWLCL